MICAVSLASLLLGAALAYAADRFPSRLKLLEATGGALLVTGLALIGSGLPLVH
jgi:hypothetical protein